MSEEEKNQQEERRIARAFRLELKAAREQALADAEAFDGIIQVIERYGSRVVPNGLGLGDYRDYLFSIADHSELATRIPSISPWRILHMPFGNLFNLVQSARNDAVHIGAHARTLTDHCIQLALVLEDGLCSMEDPKFVSDFMIRNPVCAELWQPVSFARQMMLTYSYSYLPILIDNKEWRLLSDQHLARYLQRSSDEKNDPDNRKARLGKPLSEAILSPDLGDLHKPHPLSESTTLRVAIEQLDDYPCLVFRHNTPDELVGILTAFDLL